MPKRSMNNLYIRKVLLDKTNQDFPLTSKGIIDELSFYGITIERKAVYEAVENLKHFSIDIKQSKVKPKGFYIAAREFDIPELKLLLDAVQSSKFITKKKSIELMDKIKQLTDIHSAKKLQREIHISNRVKSDNEKIYYNIDKIHQAIGEKKKITFQYCSYSMSKRLVTRKGGKYYTYSPIALIWDDEYYYLVVYDDSHKDSINFRVDKMKSIEILDEKAAKSHNSLDIGLYANQIFSMFGGEVENVTLRADNSLIGVFIDKFGKGISIIKNENTFDVTVKAAVSTSFFGWLFQLSDKVKIIEPACVFEKYLEQIEKTKEVYN